MKYIRTKDGIIYYKATQMCDGNWQVKTKTGRYIKISKSLVLKIADTIEKLCDKWVLIDRTGFNEPYVCDTYRESKELKENDDDLMGAVWTDKGLIYVAKLNDKGELELL